MASVGSNISTPVLAHRCMYKTLYLHVHGTPNFTCTTLPDVDLSNLQTHGGTTDM